ncbi:MAG: nucleotide-binding protein [Thermoguttaceae bacterium]
MKLTVAVAGKGGIGKTTLAALLVRTLTELGSRPVLAVDADPNSTLAEALGLEAGRPLADIRDESSSPEGSPASGTGRVRFIDDEVQRAITEADGFDLITMGRPEGPRCYCYVNNLLRKSLDNLACNYEAVVVDNEAGMEHLSRRTTNNVDFLIAVLNPTLPSLRAAERIIDLSRDLPVQIGHVAVLVNRVGPDGAGAAIERKLATLNVMRLSDVPEDVELERLGAIGGDIFQLSCSSPVLSATKTVAAKLFATLSVA